MNIQQRIKAFIELGTLMNDLVLKGHPKMEEAYMYNHWFTPENIKYAFHAWAEVLTESKLESWLSGYELSTVSKKVAIIMAGNVPLVGLHDLLCVLASGHQAIVKCSSDDKILPQFLIDELLKIEPEFKHFIYISDERLPKDFDAVIATGSNNSNRYFEYYFRNKPSLLRRNRTSVAILSGDETPDDFNKLGDDMFVYFGFGCRNISKIYVPDGYQFNSFFEGIESWHRVMDHHKYANNYIYHKAIFLMNQTPHLDNNFIVVKEDDSVYSPPGTLFYQYYDSIESVRTEIIAKQSEIQCVVSKIILPGTIPLGSSQHPGISDYADGADTMKFLTDL